MYKGTAPQGIKSLSPEETFDIGKEIAANLNKGAIIALAGVLGAGKTCLIKGIGQGLKVDEEITSPTYTIISEYQAELNGESLPFYHIDAYRLNGADDFSAMGGEEYLYSNGITVIEWSERIVESLPKNTMKILIEINKDNSRTIHISGSQL